MIVFPKMIMIVLTFYYCQENNHSPVYYYLTQENAVIGGRLLFVPCLSCYSQDCHKTTLYYIILGFCKVNKNKTLAETVLLDRSLHLILSPQREYGQEIRFPNAHIAAGVYC